MNFSEKISLFQIFLTLIFNWHIKMQFKKRFQISFFFIISYTIRMLRLKTIHIKIKNEKILKLVY
jgi:hypothetical protein